MSWNNEFSQELAREMIKLMGRPSSQMKIAVSQDYAWLSVIINNGKCCHLCGRCLQKDVCDVAEAADDENRIDRFIAIHKNCVVGTGGEVCH